MTQTTTHMIPADLAPRTHLHYRYAQLAGQLLVAVVLGLIVMGALLTSHYGDATTYDQGYTLGDDTSAVQVGYETVGDPGLFGHVKTPWGVAGFADGDAWFCPTGWTDTQCGA